MFCSYLHDDQQHMAREIVGDLKLFQYERVSFLKFSNVSKLPLVNVIRVVIKWMICACFVCLQLVAWLQASCKVPLFDDEA